MSIKVNTRQSSQNSSELLRKSNYYAKNEMFVNLFLKTLNISVVIYDNKTVGSRPCVCYVVYSALLRTQGYRSIIRPTLE